VADLVRSVKYARGRASLTWRSRNVAGTHVLSGAYLLRVAARTEEGKQASAATMLYVGRLLWSEGKWGQLSAALCQ